MKLSFTWNEVDFNNIQFSLSYTWKCMGKWQKTGFMKNAIIFKKKIFFWFKIRNINFKRSNQIVLEFQVCMFCTAWEMVKNKKILFHKPYLKNRKFLRNRTVWKSHMTVERSFQVEARVASIAIIQNAAWADYTQDNNSRK